MTKRSAQEIEALPRALGSHGPGRLNPDAEPYPAGLVHRDADLAATTVLVPRPAR